MSNEILDRAPFLAEQRIALMSGRHVYFGARPHVLWRPLLQPAAGRADLDRDSRRDLFESIAVVSGIVLLKLMMLSVLIYAF